MLKRKADKKKKYNILNTSIWVSEWVSVVTNFKPQPMWKRESGYQNESKCLDSFTFHSDNDSNLLDALEGKKKSRLALDQFVY